MLLLAGEAGIGKTRLLGDIARRADASGYTILRCGAFPRDAEVAGGVLVDLARALRSSADPGVAAAGREMAERLAAGGTVSGDGHRRRRLLTADLTDLVAVAGTGPVLLGVEDLHWADDLTLEVLARLARCEEGYEASAAIEDAVYLFPHVLTGTRAYLRRGEPTNARDWLDRTERLILLRSIPGTLPALDHARGLLHLASGHTGKAREALTLASSAWLERRRVWEGVQALLDLATCAVRSRRPAEAAALRARAHEQASSAGMVALISTEAVSAGTPPPLTAREIEVARLIATGATNREIAAALFIAPKTVSAHVEHILTKLGAGRRAEIAAWAAAHPPNS